jgi:adenylylsulfate kinase
MFRETHARSIAKAFSWRFMGTIATSAIVFLFTKKLVVSLAVGGIEFLSKIALFWLHERVWDRLTYGKQEIRPAVLWFTGLSGSGKSTIAGLVHAEMRRRGYKVERLDGDSIREIFPETGYTRVERDQHLRRVGHLAGTLEANGVIVVASFTSPYIDTRDFVRSRCREFIEIYVSTPLEECERRDVKGLYARARRGEITNFTGIDDPYEAPRHPELTIDTRTLPPEQAAMLVVNEYFARTGQALRWTAKAGKTPALNPELERA